MSAYNMIEESEITTEATEVCVMVCYKKSRRHPWQIMGKPETGRGIYEGKTTTEAMQAIQQFVDADPMRASYFFRLIEHRNTSLRVRRKTIDKHAAVQ